MRKSAEKLNFEEAAGLRDEIKELSGLELILADQEEENL